MNLRCILFIISSLVLGQLSAQTSSSIKDADKKTRKCFTKAQKAADKKDFQKAKTLYQEVLDKNDQIIEAQLELALIHMKLKENDQAIPLLEELVEINPAFEPKAAYTLYSLYTDQENYKQARKYIGIFNDLYTQKDKRKKKLLKELKTAIVRDSLSANPVDFEAVALDRMINTRDSEYLPAVTADGSQLIFTRRDMRQEDFYLAEMDSVGNSTSVTPLNQLNTAGNEGAHCISQDGLLLIFTACDRPDGKGSCDLYYSSKTKNGWSKPKNMGSKINTEFWESQPSLSADASMLYYTSKREGGQGGKDIWVSTLIERRWQTPINLGSDINTTGEEASPFIHPDNQTLYFRSNRHPGMGKFDIFFTKKKNQKWGKPINLGYPINTINDEGALFVTVDGQEAYFATDKLNNEEDNLVDIYKFELPDYAKPEEATYVKFQVKDSDTNVPIAAKLLIVDINNNDTIIYKKATESGTLLTTLAQGSEYAVFISSPNYIFYSEHLAFGAGNVLEPISKEILLQPIAEEVVVEEVKPIILNNVFYASGSAELLDKSDPEISKLAQLLNENSTFKIQILGHTDDVGSENDNRILSQKRAESVRSALERKGILGNRIQAIGKGESMSIANNDTEEGKALNRRTEFIILK